MMTPSNKTLQEQIAELRRVLEATREELTAAQAENERLRVIIDQITHPDSHWIQKIQSLSEPYQTICYLEGKRWITQGWRTRALAEACGENWLRLTSGDRCYEIVGQPPRQGQSVE